MMILFCTTGSQCRCHPSKQGQEESRLFLNLGPPFLTCARVLVVDLLIEGPTYCSCVVRLISKL